MSKRRYRPAYFAATLLALGGCTAHDRSGTSLFAKGAQSGAAQYAALPAERAASRIVLPTSAGRVASVDERRSSTGLRQDIALDDTAVPSRNVVAVSLTPQHRTLFGDRSIGLGRPGRSDIRAELRDSFPDVAMDVMTRAVRNTYGPYGLATGLRADGLRCLYAWQWIGAGHAGLPDRDTDVSLRVTLCRRGVSADVLKRAIDDLRIVPEGVTVRPVAQALPRRAERHVEPPVRRTIMRSTPAQAPAARPFAANAAARIPGRAVEAAVATVLDPDIPARAYRGPTYSEQRRAALPTLPTATSRMPDAGTDLRETTTETPL